ncbi:MAG: hypothetical protein GY828_01015, partial [Candidatus Gracilibacteria bacterium]|nr:hypothetical protein [Candidatus Gracilibacteria bacterium]
QVSNKEGSFILSDDIEINVLEDIRLTIAPLDGKMKVGGDVYSFAVSLRDNNGSILNKINSRIYINMDPVYGKMLGSYVELENGTAHIDIQTSTAAGTLPVEYQIEGLGEIITKEMTIFPDLPVKVDLSLSQSKIEANPDVSTHLQVELKDRYGNIVFNDNTTLVSLEIDEKYSHILTENIGSQKVIKGKALFDLNATENPGVAYFKVSTNKISNFIHNQKTISGISENAGKVETFFFWNKKTIEDNNYNTLYTTLLGSNYGDITQENYLGGSLLFDRNNKALSVTSLLNVPYSFNDAIKIEPEGGIKFIYNSGDFTQDIVSHTSIKNNKLSVSLTNEGLNN